MRTELLSRIPRSFLFPTVYPSQCISSMRPHTKKFVRSIRSCLYRRMSFINLINRSMHHFRDSTRPSPRSNDGRRMQTSIWEVGECSYSSYRCTSRNVLEISNGVRSMLPTTGQNAIRNTTGIHFAPCEKNLYARETVSARSST